MWRREKPAAASPGTTHPSDLEETVRRALAEDVGGGDLTANLIPSSSKAYGHVITRDKAVLCGAAWFNEVFRQLDRDVRIEWLSRDGDTMHTNQVLCTVEGPARAILTGERTALNFLQALSGTATTTRHYVEAVRGTNTVILDTRKTLPGLRTAQKYAVRCGGGQNHRMGLYDAILIKENHIAAAGSVSAAVQAARKNAPAGTTVEVEVESLEQLREALAAGADRLLLDNFSLKRLREAVRETAGRAKLEASGGITIENVRMIAETGVDCISIGALTKHLRAVDLSLRFTTG
jgi:nicotinate-nucleotide pyrophosphorylase (carboxylating)